MRRTNLTLVLLAAVGALAAGTSTVASPRQLAEERMIDLADGADVRIIGAPPKDQLGNDMHTGDLNGDGIADLALGAHWAATGGRNIVGRTYVVFGRHDWPAELDLYNSEVPDWWFFGAGREARMGSAVATGDLSGDGVADLLIGSLLADQLDQHNGGAVYVMFGGSGVGGYVDFLHESPDALLVGDSRTSESDQLGSGIVTGDFNADGHADIAVAALFRKRGSGGVFVWLGPIARGAVHNLRTERADWSIAGPDVLDAYVGVALAAGDVTGDGVDDLAVGAGYLGLGDRFAGTGHVLVFPGGDAAEYDVTLPATSAPIAIQGLPGSHLSVASGNGRSMGIADVTGDGVGDLIVGSPLDEDERGSVSVLAGPLAPGELDLAETRHLRLTGTRFRGHLGWMVATGHLDSDGYTDLLAAVPWAQFEDRTKAGLVLGLRGPLEAQGTVTLTEGLAPLVVAGPEASAGDAGITVALADTNGDGAADLHLGFPDAAPLDRQTSGAAYIVRGPLLADVPTATPTTTRTPTVTLTPDPVATDTAQPTVTPRPTVAATPSRTSSPVASPTTTPNRSYLPNVVRRH